MDDNTREVGVIPTVVPDNMIALKSVTTTICDNLGYYCPVGAYAVLDQETAQHYLDLGMVQVPLPEMKGKKDAASVKTASASGEDQRKV